ncbi:MAG: glycosyltransferase family 4 protein [Chthoniobacterales bacterium]
MIRRLFDDLRSVGTYDVEHLAFAFSPTVTDLRTVSWHKMIEVIRIYTRLVQIRWRGPIDLLWFPAGGPQTVPIVRDLLLLPFFAMFARRIVVQFHAAGIADRLNQLPRVAATIIAAIYRLSVDSAIVMLPFNRRDPARLGIRDIIVQPFRFPDANPAGQLASSRSDETCFLHIGHLYHLKGTTQLLEAFARFVRRHPRARLTLAGSFAPPFDAVKCNKMLRELALVDSVSVVGELHGEDKDDCFQRSDCLIFPSIAPYESFGLVLVEALMWGLPVLATDWRGNSDILGDPPGGIVFSPEGDLASRIEETLERAMEDRSRWSDWALRNRRRFCEHFRRNSDTASEYPVHRLLGTEFPSTESSRPIEP